MPLRTRRRGQHEHRRAWQPRAARLCPARRRLARLKAEQAALCAQLGQPTRADAAARQQLRRRLRSRHTQDAPCRAARQ